MTYCEDLDLLSIGFRDGKIQSFFMNIEFDKDNSDDSDEDDGSGRNNNFNQARKNEGTLLMKKAFE
jgi:hypothetical protein